MSVYYTKQHEWIRVENEIGTVGITQYAVEQLGDVTFIEFPDEGSTVAEEEVVCSIESVKAVSEVYAPVAGTVTRVNDTLTDNPELVNQSPEEDGWLIEIEIKSKESLEGLMSAESYQEYVQELE